MRTLLPTFAATCLALACGSSSTSDGGSSSSASGGSSGSKVTPFLGTYSCNYTGTYTNNGSTTVETTTPYSATATIAAGTTTDLLVSGLFASDVTVTGNCDTTLDITSSTTATFSPTEQACAFTEANGDNQTNTRTGTFTLQGATAATAALNGTYTGTTAAGVAYSGVYSGSFACTRN